MHGGIIPKGENMNKKTKNKNKTKKKTIHITTKKKKQSCRKQTISTEGWLLDHCATLPRITLSRKFFILNAIFFLEILLVDAV